METRARLHNITRDYKSGKPLLTFEVDTAPPEELERIQDKELSLKATLYRKKRSLNANAYFHVLNDKIAKATGVSRFYSKNTLISRYGQREIINDNPVTITTKAPGEYMMEQEFLHTYLCAVTEKPEPKTGELVTWYSYIVYRGSHTYNTEEMSQLIDGTVEEAKQLGIETLTPEEIARMEAEWAAK